jgi:hypothetical protein
MPGTFERFYRKYGNPNDYNKAATLCDEADQIITVLQLHSSLFKYSEIEEKSIRLVQIHRVLESKYFGPKATSLK